MHTQRLVLRALEERDRQALFEMNSDPEVMAWLGGPMTREASDALAAKLSGLFREQGWGVWAAELASTGVLIGFVGLHRPDYQTPFTPCLEVAWRLCRQYWGHGYATEAATAALEYAFVNLEEPEVVSFTAVANYRSRKVMERLGMSRDVAGDFDHPNVAVGDPLRRHVLYRLSRDRPSSDSP